MELSITFDLHNMTSKKSCDSKVSHNSTNVHPILTKFITEHLEYPLSIFWKFHGPIYQELENMKK